MKNTFTFALICTVSMLSSCATPLPISMLTSESETSRWVSGREYVQQEKDGIGISLSYYRNEDDLLVFDAMVDNYSNETVEMNPLNVELIALNGNRQFLNSVIAINPEAKLLAYDQQEAREKTQLQNDATANLVFSIADLTATIADESDKNIRQDEKDRRFNQRLLWSEDRTRDIERQEAYIESIQNTRLYWEEIPIRRSDIGPNQYLDGRLFFTRNQQATFYQVIFHFPDKRPITFEYKQVVIPSAY